MMLCAVSSVSFMLFGQVKLAGCGESAQAIIVCRCCSQKSCDDGSVSDGSDGCSDGRRFLFCDLAR